MLVAATHLQQSLQELVKSGDHVGICTLNNKESTPVCVNGEQKFLLQSVVKMIVGAAVLDAVDNKKMKLDDTIVLTPNDASPGPQELAKLIRSKGTLKVTIEELMQRSIAESDSTSVDVLIKHLGGVSVVQDFLKRKNILDIRIDRDERTLQSESLGLVWRSEYANNKIFRAAVKKTPKKIRDAAWNSYLKDVRDTSTPIGMVNFLKALHSGEILSKASTKKLLNIMTATTTGADRLKAGLPKGWSVAHKTGSGITWKGIASATNDVGILTAPDGGWIVVAVFVGESKGPNHDRAAALIAESARLITRAYLQQVIK